MCTGSFATVEYEHTTYTPTFCSGAEAILLLPNNQRALAEGLATL